MSDVYRNVAGLIDLLEAHDYPVVESDVTVGRDALNEGRVDVSVTISVPIYERVRPVAGQAAVNDPSPDRDADADGGDQEPDRDDVGGAADDPEDLEDSEEPSLRCEYPGCDYATDSERGLAIHQGRVHKDEPEPESDPESESESEPDTALEDEAGGGDSTDDPEEADEAVAASVADGGSTIEASGVSTPPGPVGEPSDPPSPARFAAPEAFVDWGAESGTRPQCGHCGHHLTKDFIRVFEPDSEPEARACPNCGDVIRESDGTVREKRPGHKE